MTWTAPGLPAWKPGNTQVVIRIIIITHHSNVFYSSTYTWCQILWLWLPSTWLRLLLPNQQLHLQWPGPVYNRDFLSVEEGDWLSTITHFIWGTDRKEITCGKSLMLTCVQYYVDISYLSRRYFSCSCDLTGKEPAEVVCSQNHSFVPAKQTLKSHLLLFLNSYRHTPISHNINTTNRGGE